MLQDAAQQGGRGRRRRKVLEKVVYTATMPVAVPVHLVFSAGLKKAVDKARASAPVPEMLEYDATANGLPSPKRMAPHEELDYLEHRSAAYVKEMVRTSAREFSRSVSGANKQQPYTDEELSRVIVSGSGPAILTRRNADNTAWETDTSSMRKMPFFRPEHFEVVKFVHEPAAGRYEIHTADGRVYRPGESLWHGARQKLVAQLSIWCSLGHSWTHFWLPDVVAAKVTENLPRDTNLYRLLAPHTRFTNRHNHAGLWIQRSVDNKPGLSKKLVPWLIVPATKENVRASLTSWAKQYHESADHFTLPERIDRRLPFWDFLGAWWDVIDAFVKRLAPHLEADAWKTWAAEVARWYPRFDQVPMERAVAMIIWHMGVIHGVEHLAYGHWGRRWGFCDVSRSIRDLARNPPKGYDRYRFLTFLQTFVDFRPPPSGLDLRLVTSPEAYGFPAGSPTAAAAAQFGADMRAMDARLRAEGRDLLKLDEMIRTICF